MSLSPEEIDDAVEMLCRRSMNGQIRSLLVDGIPVGMWGRVPTQSSMIDRYRSDLQTLRDEMIDEETPAVAVYLENAAQLFEPSVEAGWLRQLAARVRAQPLTVLTFAPRGPTGWRERAPYAKHLAADAPTGPWHRTALPGSAEWRRALAEIRRLTGQLSGRHGGLMVYASIPYALGAVLGNVALNQPMAPLHIFQAEGPAGAVTWTDFGPAPIGLPSGSTRLKQRVVAKGSEAQVALMCGLTWAPNLDEIRPGLDDAGATDATLIELVPPVRGQEGLAGRAAVDDAVHALEHAIDQAARRPGIKVLHVFFNGPLAVLMRASGKLHQPSARIVFHERGPSARYRPAIRFDRGQVLVCESAT